MNNKQRWMGGVVLLGGGVLLGALLLKGKEEIHHEFWLKCNNRAKAQKCRL